MFKPGSGSGEDVQIPGGRGSTANSSRQGRLLPVAFVAVVACVGANVAAGQISDPDTWWHLRLGEEFRSGWSPANPGQLSPFATEPWVATQWTGEVGASLLVDTFGLAGVAAATGLLVILLVLSLWRLAQRYAAPLPAALVTGLAAIGTLPVLAPRPQLLSLLFLTVFLAVWLQSARDLVPRWWLVPLSWLWACTHGFWFLGALVGTAIVIGLVFDREAPRHAIVRLSWVPLLCVVAAGVTPSGPRLLTAPLAVSGITKFITEWQPPSFSSPPVFAVWLMSVGVILTLARTGQSPWSHLMLLVLGLWLLVYAARTVPLAAVLLVPLLADASARWSSARGPSMEAPRKTTALVGVTGLALVVLALTVMYNQPYGRPVPDRVDASLSVLGPHDVVFNDYALGGYLAWRHPELAHGIDGMTEAFPPAFVEAYIDALRLEPGWEEFLDELEATYALLPADDRMARELETHLGWTVVQQTTDLVLLQSPEGRVDFRR